MCPSLAVNDACVSMLSFAGKDAEWANPQCQSASAGDDGYEIMPEGGGRGEPQEKSTVARPDYEFVGDDDDEDEHGSTRKAQLSPSRTKLFAGQARTGGEASENAYSTLSRKEASATDRSVGEATPRSRVASSDYDTLRKVDRSGELGVVANPYAKLGRSGLEGDGDSAQSQVGKKFQKGVRDSSYSVLQRKRDATTAGAAAQDTTAEEATYAHLSRQRPATFADRATFLNGRRLRDKLFPYATLHSNAK